MKPVLIICLSVLYAGHFCMAQSTDSTVATKKKTTFSAGVLFNSNLHYYGRTDSIKSRGITPFAGINFSNGLYLFSGVVFINNPVTTTYAATSIEGGYRFSNKKGNWTGNIFGSWFFYQDDITLLQSVIKAQTGINISNTNKIINVNIGGDARFSEETDFGAFAGLDHAFRFNNIGKGVIVVDPSVYAYAGTQQFTKTWQEQKRFLFLPVGEETLTATEKQFNLLSCEISCPVIYGVGKMNILVTPALVLPQNVIMADNQPGTAPALFYTTAMVRFTF